MEKINFANSSNPSITMSAIVDTPPDFDPARRYPAIISTHPSGGVKEQTAGLYARRLAEHGFVTITTDASYQGESTGEPRQLESPAIRVEDVSAVLDHLLSVPYVDPDRIGAFGICAGGGYTVNAAVNDHRIRAVGLVSVVNLGAVFRDGYYQDLDPKDALSLLEQGAAARSSDAAGGPERRAPLVPMTAEEAPNEELRQVWEYYFTPRAAYPTAVGWATGRSMMQIVTYDPFHLADVFLTQPLLLVAGSNAGTKWMGDRLFEMAASTDKHMHVIEGPMHMELYDTERYVTEAVAALAPFFRRTLATR